MLTKEKAMYQTWLIIEGLSAKERNMISKELLERIKSTMEYDENIKIDFSIPLEEQNLDLQTWEMLYRIIQDVGGIKYKANITLDSDEIESIRLENIALNEEIQEFKKNSEELVVKYKEECEKLLAENNKIKEDCNSLINTMNLIPSFIRKVFIKDEKIKLLIAGK